MVTVITYGTYDLLHYGHIRLLERAKALGDYLIVGVTADDFDRIRGKINVQQTLEERIAAIRNTGIADKIIVESYEGQKIDDIRTYDVDIFTVGSDWVGTFDYLNAYCKVVYLPRTEGISSTELRQRVSPLRLGMIGYSDFLIKFYRESKYVNAVSIVGLYVPQKGLLEEIGADIEYYTDNLESLYERVDAVYINAHPNVHFEQCRQAILRGKHVMCESPVALKASEVQQLRALAAERKVIFMEAIRTAYITAYLRMLLLLKSGKIGDIVAVDVTCTSLSTDENPDPDKVWGAMKSWGPTALLPIFQILGLGYTGLQWFSMPVGGKDSFTKLSLAYEHATATMKVGTGVKSEGELVVSGTRGYVYVPAPWWKTDYFEIRYETPADNRRYFYQVDGEGIRYELVAFAKAIREGRSDYYIDKNVTDGISGMMEQFLAFRREQTKGEEP